MKQVDGSPVGYAMYSSLSATAVCRLGGQAQTFNVSSRLPYDCCD